MLPAPSRAGGAKKWLVALALLGIVAVLGVSWLVLASRDHDQGSGQSSLIPNPPPPDLQRINGLAFWNFSLERKEGSTVTHAVARVVNESDKIRYGIEVKLQLLDEVGREVGTAKDYLDRLEPGQEGQVRALVIKREAVSARVLSVIEQ